MIRPSRHPATACSAWTALRIRRFAVARRARAALIPCAVALLFSAVPLSAEELPRTLHPLRQQTSDQVIQADLALIDAWRLRLDMLPANRNLWRGFVARAWLESARAEYLDGDRTGYPQAAFARAVTLIDEIERGAASATFETVATAVPPRGSGRVADSLYATLEALKRDRGFLCAAEELASLEMQLAWAGNEQLDQGHCHMSPHIAEAQRLAEIARHKVESCKPPLLAVLPPIAIQPPAVSAPDTVAVPKLEIPTVEELHIPRNIHFGLDRADLSPTSHQVIAGIVNLLQKYPSITLRLDGHTDSRGDSAYNLALSERRVMAARAVFLELGIDSSRITWTYKGKSELYATEDSKRGFARNRRVEMVFVDPEGRAIKSERQEMDIQIEADRAKPPVKKLGVPKQFVPGAKSGAKRRTTGAAPGAGARPRGSTR